MHRTGQRFGVTYMVEVLLGKGNERIRRFGHDKVSTFGIVNELNQREWSDLYRQLIARGLLAVDLEGHGGLHLTAAGLPRSDVCVPVGDTLFGGAQRVVGGR